MTGLLQRDFRMILTGLLLAVAMTFFVAIGSSSSVAAQSTAKEAVCQGIGAAVGGGGDDCSGPDGDSTLDNTLATVIDLLSLIVTVIAIIMLIIGGFRYVTSAGDSGSATGARNTIIYALVGIAIVALAQIIVIFTVSKTTDSGTATQVVNPNSSNNFE